jgi:DNA-binding GntR family transcriptional regulator
MNDFLPLENYKPLRDVVFDYMKDAIITGKLKPGERLMEVQLAEKLGVSRTPVREAIRKLELEGLVVMVPRKGAYVADLDAKDLLNVLEVRSSLEGLAASLAAERITEEEIDKLKKIIEEFQKKNRRR